MTAWLGAVAFTLLWCASSISGTSLRWQGACHQFLLNALACSVLWSPPDLRVSSCSLHCESSNLGCPWAPEPYVHLLIQRLVLGSFYRDHAVRASTCLHVMTRLARGRSSLSLGTDDAPTSCMLLKLIDIRLLFRYAQFFLRGQKVANH